jgi:hypothetical protein
MGMIFNNSNNGSIAICIVDNTNRCQSGWAKEISINLTDQLIYKFSTFDIYIDSNEDSLLKQVQHNYTHAVMIASGTSLKLNDKIFNAIEDLCQQDFFIAGHILDRKSSYYELHHQFYIVNLKDYIDIGSPPIGFEEDVAHSQVEPIRSQENVHDDYVPLWIKQGSKTKEYVKKMHGWNILSTALINNKTIIDIGPRIRESKLYLYYEYDHVFLRELPTLYQNQFFAETFVPGWNSDHLLDSIDFNGPVEQYVTLGTGFNWIKNLTLVGYNKDTKVIFTDVNVNCLQFMENMITKWNGEDYTAFYRDFIKSKIPNGPLQLDEVYLDSVNTQWEKFKNSFEDWHSTWSSIRELNYQFIPINYTASYNLDWLESNKKTLMNFSDLFTYTPTAFLLSLKYRIACENKLFLKLKEKDPNITVMLTARVSDGFKNSASRYFGRIEDIDLTDINDLKRPPWHIYDWNTLRELR